MHDVTPRLSDSLEALGREPSSGRVPRDVVRAVIRAHGRGLVVAARLNGGAHAARTALLNTAILSKDEEAFLHWAPTGDARYKALVDAYAMWALNEVAEL